LELDFSEEDVEFADRTQLRDLVLRIRKYLGGLISSFSLGNAIKTGVTTVIAGRPNAGKSTLLNALLNEARAIVSDIPGTTRDTIEEVLNINGIQFRLVDTAGIREAQDQIEAIGVQRTLDKVKEAAVLLYVWDVAGGMTLEEVFTDLQHLRGDSMKLLVVCNKMDRNPHFRTDWLVDPGQAGIHPYLLGDPPADLSAHAGTLEAEQLVPVSAKNEQNIALLREKLFELASGGMLNLESTVVSNARHFDALQRADQALQDVLHGLDTGITGDFIAQDIRRSLAYLGEITGEIGVDDLLANIFGKFCIGK
ncbi:MAG: tRNA modification GTPase, partial [Bacteroidota bacterium]